MLCGSEPTNSGAECGAMRSTWCSAERSRDCPERGGTHVRIAAPSCCRYGGLGTRVARLPLPFTISCVHASAKLRCANSSGTVKTPTRCPRLGSGCGVGEPPLAASVVSKCAAARMRPLWSYSARICMPIEICTRPTGSGGQASQRDEPDCIKDRDRSPFRG